MITNKETIIVTHDDKLAESYKKALKEEDGWEIEEDITATYYTREFVMGVKQ